MADLSLRNDFVNGVQEIFTTMFNDGETDGLKLYLLSENVQKNVYGEQKYKMYQQPKMLVTQARLTPTQGENDVEGIKDKAVFVVPLKSLQDNELGVTNADLDIIRKGVIEFHGVYYEIENILPKAYVADVFVLYHFVCSEDKYTTSILIEELPTEEELPEDDTTKEDVTEDNTTEEQPEETPEEGIPDNEQDEIVDEIPEIIPEENVGDVSE